MASIQLNGYTADKRGMGQGTHRVGWLAETVGTVNPLYVQIPLLGQKTYIPSDADLTTVQGLLFH